MVSKSIYLFLFIFLHIVAIGQTISGRIIDDKQVPVAYSTIALVSSTDSAVVKGSLASEEGVFTIEQIPRGSYLLKIEAIGFTLKYTEAILVDSSSNINIQDIILNTSTVNLNEVSISAIKKTIEFKNGNIVVNVEDSPLAKGNTVYDLLSKLPGVSIDNNIVQLNGKTGVIFMIDGRVQQVNNAQLINLLKSMNAELVDKIELFKNPPVKYDATGTSGMINIKTKKTKLVGFNGSIYSSASQGVYARLMSGISLNYKSDKLVLFSNIDYNNGTYYNISTLERKFINDSTTTQFNGRDNVKDRNIGFTYKVGADWYINKKNIIGFKIDGDPGSYNSDINSTNNVSQFNNLGFDHLKASAYTPDNWNITNYNINAEHSFDTIGSILSFNSDYTRLTETYSNKIENYFLNASGQEALPANIYRSKNVNATDIFASKLDFKKVLNTNTSFELGAKTSFLNTKNNYLFERKNNLIGTYYSDTSLTNNYVYSEQTFAAYFNFSKSFKKVNMQIGLRAENTNLIGKNTERAFELKRSYYNIFPNIAIEYLLSDNHNFQLNLNRRIDRPAYNDLNPFRFYRDQYSYNEGNPFLLPHYSNTIDFSHTYKNFLTNTFTYTRINNVFLHYTKQSDTSKVLIESISNMKYNNNYAYSFFFQRDIKSWWNLSANGLVSYIVYAGDINKVAFKTASFYYSPSLTNSLVIAKKIKLEIVTFYRSGKNNGLVQVKSRWLLSFAIKKTLLKDKLDVSIGIDDVFYSSYFRTGVDFDNQHWNFMTHQDSRRVTFSLNYNFGKVKTEERNVESNEEEKGRLNH